MESMNPVRAARQQRRWTMEQLAGRSMISLRTLVRVEHGEPTNRSTALVISHALGAAPIDLFPDLFGDPPTATDPAAVAA